MSHPTPAVPGFTRLPAPDPDDVQSFDEFVVDADRNTPSADRRALVIFNVDHCLDAAACAIVAGWVGVFYPGCPVRVMPLALSASKPRGALAVSTPSGDIRIRSRKGTLGRQLNVSDLVDVVIALVPDDAFAACAITTHDMFEGKDDEFICGRAYGGSRASVVSAARYDVTVTPRVKREMGEDDDAAVKWHRVASTTAHELGHCFGIDHCVHYRCAMNETSNITEDVSGFFELCPLDLAKLVASTGCDTQARYEGMAAWLREHGGGGRREHAAWAAARAAGDEKKGKGKAAKRARD